MHHVRGLLIHSETCASATLVIGMMDEGLLFNLIVSSLAPLSLQSATRLRIYVRTNPNDRCSLCNKETPRIPQS